MPRYLVTRAVYHQMIAAEIFDEDDKLELLEGALVPMTPQGVPHSKAIIRLTKLLVIALGDRAEVGVQVPYAASEISEPEPDLYIAPTDLPDDDHPTRAYCIIEVAVTSRRRDTYKAGIYARAQVQQYILIDVERREARVFREPRDGDWDRIDTIFEGTPVVVDAFPDVSFDLAAVLPAK